MIHLQHVSFGYIKRPMLLIDVNLKLSGGGLFVFGQQGAGKTSLLELICGMQQLYVGNIKVCGKLPQEATQDITYLPVDVVALKNKTVLQNMQYACDAINKDYNSIDLNDVFIKEYANTKFKKLSKFNQTIFAIKRAKIKDAKVILIDVNLKDFSQEEVQKYSKILFELIQDKNKITVISINAEDFKKLQIDTKKSEICYIFATNVQKFDNFTEFSSNVNYMGMAEYLPLKSYIATVQVLQSGNFLKVQDKTIKLLDKFVSKIQSYFDEVTTSTSVKIFTNLDITGITDQEFNNYLSSGEILLYDTLTTERLN